MPSTYHPLMIDTENLIFPRSYLSTIYNFLELSYEILIKTALPMAISYTFSASIAIVGKMAASAPGNTSENNTAAAGLIMDLMSALVSVADTPSFSINILINGYRGELKEADRAQSIELKEKITKTLRPGLLLTTAVGILPTITMYYSKEILIWFKQNPSIAGLVELFLKPYSFAIQAKIIRMCFEQILFAYEIPWITMALAITSLAIGTPLAYLFCFGTNTITAEGLKGIANGFLTESYLTALFFGLCLAFHPKFKNLPLIKGLFAWPNKKEWFAMKELAKYALPMTLTTISQVSTPLMISTFAGWLSTQTLAAQAYCSWLIFFLIIPELAIGQAVSQKVKRELGTAQTKVKNTQLQDTSPYSIPTNIARKGLAITLVAMSILCIPFTAYPKMLTDFINNQDSTDSNIISMAQIPIIITSIGIILEALSNTMAQTLRQLNENIIPATIITISQWLGVATAYTLAFTTGLGINGLATGYVIGNLIATLSLIKPWYEKTKAENLADATHSLIPKDLKICCWQKSRTTSEEMASPLLI